MSTQETPQNEQEDPLSFSDSDSDSDSSSDSDSDSPNPKKKSIDSSSDEEEIPSDDDTPAANIKRFNQVINSRRYKKQLDKEEDTKISEHELFNFPIDRENWKEEDLKELWADGPLGITKPGWDPAWVDESDWKEIVDDVVNGKCEDPPIAPFYLPYRKYYPAIPDNHPDISNPKAVVEELDRIEEFLKWVSYVFPDGSTFEGTVWDDLAHGKGVYVAEQGLVRYEGEWLQNNMEGHGVVEVDVPDMEPLPGSKLEEEMRAEGKVFKRDFMDPEDKKWLEMDIEDSVELTGDTYEIPWYENEEWVRQYGEKPEKGRYRYAGQWKHSRMHGCGVYEVNERTIYGRFYFGELVEDPDGCDADICAMHAGIAEVAAAKARMFVNKPDGMVREERGPYGDPQHPYFYEDEDVWQAPGFINQFYEVPDYWKTYVQEVDQEREMWLNSFYKAPLRLPMPAELQYWWENDQPPEFVLLNKEPEPDPEDPSKLIYTEDPVILHTPTGRLINYVEDEEHGVRLFWQPPVKEGEDVEPEKVEFLPLGFDEFYGRETEKKETFLGRVMSSVVNTIKPWVDNLAKWTEEQKQAAEMRKKLIEQELELVEAELSLEEAIEDMEEELKQEEKEAEKDAELELPEDVPDSSFPADEQQIEEKVSPQEEEYDEEEEDDDIAPSSFGSVDDGSSKGKGNGSSKSPFSTLSFASSGLLLTIPSMVEQSFSGWKKGKSPVNLKVPTPSAQSIEDPFESRKIITFPRAFPKNMNMKAKTWANMNIWAKQPSQKSISRSQVSSVASQPMPSKNYRKWHKSNRLNWLHSAPDTDLKCILSLQVPVQCADDIYWIV